MYCLISIATNALFIYYNIETSCLPSTINESCCGDLIQKSAILIRVSPHFKYFWLFLIFNKPLLCTDYFYVRDDLQINRNRSSALSHQVSIVERRGAWHLQYLYHCQSRPRPPSLQTVNHRTGSNRWITTF